jgi:hypothetical protein
MKTVSIALILSGLGSAPTLAADAFLGKLVGEWTGRGTMKLSAGAAPERVYCKISNTLAADGNTLEQKGRCSLASNSGSVDGTITAAGGGYKGSLDSLASKGPATLAGTGGATRLELEASFVDVLTNEPAQSTTTIALSANGGYRITTSRADPKTGATFTSSEIVFTAR